MAPPFDWTNVFFLALIMFLIGWMCLSSGFWSLRKKHLIENIPTSKIRGIAMGLVEIFGKVLPSKGKTLKSPFTNRDCVYYQFEVYTWESKGKADWSLVDEGERGIPFHLRDRTGSVLVDPKDAEIEISKGTEMTIQQGKEAPAHIKRFLKQHKIGLGEKLKLIEYYITPSDRLYVMGTAGKNPLREHETAKTGIESVLIQRGSSEKLYYISNKHERKILEKFRKRTLVYWLIGAALVIFSIIGVLGVLSVPLDEIPDVLTIWVVLTLILGFVVAYWPLRARKRHIK